MPQIKGGIRAQRILKQRWCTKMEAGKSRSSPEFDFGLMREYLLATQDYERI
jgi:hypothetical protein